MTDLPIPAPKQGWIKSPGHRKNLLGAFDLCGIGAWAIFCMLVMSVVKVARSGVIRFASRCCAVLLWTVLLHAAVCPKRRRGALLMAEISGGDRVGSAVSHLVQGTAQWPAPPYGHAKKRHKIAAG